MKNLKTFTDHGIIFDPYQDFKYSKSMGMSIVEKYSQMRVSELMEKLKKTKTALRKLSSFEEAERNEITFAIFKRIELSDADSRGIDSDLLRAQDVRELERLADYRKNKLVNLGVLTSVSPVIPTRHQRSYYQLILQVGFIVGDLKFIFSKFGFDREIEALHLLSKFKVAA